jgi:hypothetical protein
MDAAHRSSHTRAIAACIPAVFALVAVVLAGCAELDPKGEPQEKRFFRTGSNIPVRETSAGDAATQDANSFQQQRIPQVGSTGPKQQ